mgnify:FL=1
MLDLKFKTMRTIFLFVDKDLLIRDLLTGNFLPQLAAKFKAVVFMQEKSYLRNKDFLFRGGNVKYEIWPVYNNRFLDWMKTFRSVFIRQFDYLNVQQFKKRNLPRTKFNRWLLPLASAGRSIFTLNLFKFLEKRFLSGKSKKNFRNYIEQHHPNLLITASCGIMNFEAEGLLLAEVCDLPTVAVNFNWDNLTSKVRSLRLPNKLVVWNESIKAIAKEMHGYKDSDVFVSGIVRFDPYFNKDAPRLPSREEFLRSKGLDPNNKTIVYASTADFVYPFQKKLISLLIELRDQGKLLSWPNIFVRLHYKDPIDGYRQFLSQPGVYIEAYASTSLERDALNLKATLLYGDVHLNYASTISLDVCALNRPLINLAFPVEVVARFPNQDFPHYHPLVQIGATRLAHDPMELVGLINGYFLNPGLDSEKRKIIADNLIGNTDGLSHKRIVDFLVDIVS